MIGLRASIIIGGVLMAIGEIALTFASMPMFYLGLGLLILGNGFFKPNISTIVGKMYRQGDPRRDRAFTIFYMGINLGAGLSPILCGYLRVHYGFRYGFAAAAVGMLIALVVFLSTQGQVLRDVEAAGNDLRVAARAKDAERRRRDPDEHQPAAGGAAGVVASGFLVLMVVAAVALPARLPLAGVPRRGAPGRDVIMPVAFGAISGWMASTLRRIGGAARDKSIVIFIFFMFAVLFWMAFEQAGNALNLWAQFHTDLTIGSLPVSRRVVAVGQRGAHRGLRAASSRGCWTWLGERGKEPSTPDEDARGDGAHDALVRRDGRGRARRERRRDRARSSRRCLPGSRRRRGADGVVVVGEGDAGRLTFEPARRTARGARRPPAVRRQ